MIIVAVEICFYIQDCVRDTGSVDVRNLLTLPSADIECAILAASSLSLSLIGTIQSLTVARISPTIQIIVVSECLGPV